MAGGFQTNINTQPAPAVAGDFADTNPRVSVNAGPGGMIAGPAGVTVGLFAWANYNYVDSDSAPVSCSNNGVGAPTGFLAREQQGIITTYLSDASMFIPAGFEMTLFSEGGFWAVNNDTVQALTNGAVYVDQATGKIKVQSATASFTGSIATDTCNFTGSVTGNLLTVSAVTSGTLAPGATVTGTGGGGVAASTIIVAQLSGTTGGVGTYALTVPEQLVTSTTMSSTVGIMSVTNIASGSLAVGDVLSGGSVTANTTIYAIPASGTGPYYVSPSQTTTSSSSLSATNTVATKWIFLSSALPGELVKISTHKLG